MAGELTELANDVWPYVSAAVSGYGAAVLKSSEEATADAAVGWGRRLLQRIFGKDEAPEALTDLVSDPDDVDLQAVLRVQIRKALASDDRLVADVRAMLGEASQQMRVHGDISNAVIDSEIQGDNIQIGTATGSSVRPSVGIISRSGTSTAMSLMFMAPNALNRG